MIVPSPGVFVVEVVDDKKEGLTLSSVNTGSRLVQGKVISVPTLRAHTTDFGASIDHSIYANVGDTIIFLSYADGYDYITLQGKRYYMVKYGDVRGVINEN